MRDYGRLELYEKSGDFEDVDSMSPLQGHKISLTIEMPHPTHPQQDQPQKLSVEDRVRDCLDSIMSGHESKREWTTVNSLYKELKGKSNPTARHKNLIAMIEPVLSHFGYHGVAGE